jgi:hypothetical protein
VRHGLARSLSQGEKASGDLKTEKGEVEKNMGTLLLLSDEMLHISLALGSLRKQPGLKLTALCLLPPPFFTVSAVRQRRRPRRPRKCRTGF